MSVPKDCTESKSSTKQPGCCPENPLDTEEHLPPSKKSENISTAERDNSCGSSSTCAPNQKSEVSQGACRELSKPQASTCCPGDSCSSKTESLAAEADGGSTGRLKLAPCCSVATPKPKPSCAKDDCCPSDAALVPSKEHVAIQVSPGKDTCCPEDADAVSCTTEPPNQTPVTIAVTDDEMENQQSASKSSPKASGLVATTKLRILNICCAMEAKLVEDTLNPLDGVSSVSVNVIGRVAYVRHLPEKISAAKMVNILNDIHLGVSIIESGSRREQDEETGLPRSLKLFGVYVVVQTVLMVIAVTGFFLKLSWYRWVAIAEAILGSVPILRKTFVSVKTCTLDINILMLIAIVGTIAIQQWIESAIVVYVYSVADGLEGFCMYKVQRTISGLMLKAPQMAVLAESGEFVRVEEVAIGTVIAVRPGDLIPLDGVVVKGQAAVDESSISGESVPVEKSVDSKVCSGTVNQNGYLEVKTTVDSSTSTVSKVAEMVEEAQASSTQTEVVINRFAKYYTPAVVIVAVLMVVVPAILGASGVGTYRRDMAQWANRALFLLVIACPCALVMAAPIAIVCGITASARNGALVKGAVHLETLARLQTLGLDKTGTLTEGKFMVTDIECPPGVDEYETMGFAAAIESKTSHPIAAAIVHKFSGCVTEMVTLQTVSLPPVSSFELHEGRGISGVVNGKNVHIGNYEFLHHVGGHLPKDMEEKYTSWSQDSKTVVFVCVDGTLAMMMSLADAIRPNSLTALEMLRDLGVQTTMITGDNSQTANAVSHKLGLDQCIPQMKPHEKLDWIKNEQEPKTPDEISIGLLRCTAGLCCETCSQGHVEGIVGMVGDGVNDGPALAAANVGIAMGAGGTALAVEAADVALMSNNLTKIPELILLGRFCRTVVRQNIVLAVMPKVLIVAVALAGMAELWMAVLADVLALLLVILNGLRPLWWKAGKWEEDVRFTKNDPFYYTKVKDEDDE